jgi:hypothetical protein
MMLRKTTAGIGLCAAVATAATALAPAATAAEAGDADTKAGNYFASIPYEVDDGERVRFRAYWSAAPNVWKVCVQANYTGSGGIPGVPGGPLGRKCWDTTADTDAKWLDVGCTFYGGTWTDASWYNKSGTRIAHRQSEISWHICN